MLTKLVAASALLAPLSAFATGNKSVSGAMVAKTLGGTGVAHFGDEFDAVLENPAMMTYSPSEVGSHKLAVQVDALFVNLEAAPPPNGESFEESKGKSFYLPFFGYFYNVSENVKFGTGLYQVAGAANDFSDSASLGKVKNSFNFLTMPFSFAYKLNDTSSFGVGLNAVSSTLSMQSATLDERNKTNYTFSPSLGYVHNFGGGHMVGATYLRGAEVTFKEMVDIDNNGSLDDIRLGNPDEFSLAYGRTFDSFSYTAEYKLVQWGNTANFDELGWKNQHVIAVAGQQKYGAYTFRGGLTYSTATVPEEKDVNGDELVDYQGTKVPRYFIQASNASSGITQSAVSLGLGYDATDALTFNTGLLYYLEKESEQTGTSAALGGDYKTSGRLQQTEVIFMASYQFTPYSFS